MAGYDLMTAGKSPAEIRRLEKRRERMGQRRFGGIEGKATLHEEMKAEHEKRKKAAAAKKTDKLTAAERVTAQGQRDNARAQRLAPAAAAAAAAAKAKAKAKAAATDTTTPNQQGVMQGRKFFQQPGTFVRALQESNTKEAEKRIVERDRLNKEYHEEEAAKKAAKIAAANTKNVRSRIANEAKRRIAERSRLNKNSNAEKDAEEGKKKPWWKLWKEGGLVKKSAAKKPAAKKSAAKKSAAKKPSRKKSIDGIARRGKTRAKHR